jgi:hypothetical protein
MYERSESNNYMRDEKISHIRYVTRTLFTWHIIVNVTLFSISECNDCNINVNN